MSFVVPRMSWGNGPCGPRWGVGEGCQRGQGLQPGPPALSSKRQPGAAGRMARQPNPGSATCPSCGLGAPASQLWNGVMVSAPVFVRTERVYTALSTVPAHSRCQVFAGAGFSAVSCGEGRGDGARGVWAESRQTSSLPLSSPGPGAGRLTHCSPVFPFVKQESQ